MAKKSNNDLIASTLGLPELVNKTIEITPEVIEKGEITIETPNDQQVLEDFETARSGIVKLANTVSKAVSDFAQLVEQSQSASGYEALAKLVTAAVTVNEKLVDIHIKKKNIKSEMPKESKSGNTNIIMVSGTELLDAVERAKKKVEDLNKQRKLAEEQENKDAE